MYARLKIFIQLSQTLTKLRLPSSHNMLKMSTIGRNVHIQTFV